MSGPDESGRAVRSRTGARRAQDLPARAARRRNGRWIIWLLGAVLVLAAVSVLQIELAKRHLESGSQILLSVSGTLKSPLKLRNPQERQRVEAGLQRGHGEFAAARDDVRLWRLVLPHLGWVPIAGQRLAAAVPATDAAYFSTGATVDLVHGLTSVWPAIAVKQSGKPLLTRVAVALQDGHRDFLTARLQSSQAVSALRQLSVHTGDSRLDRATARLRRDLPRLHLAAIWLSLAPQLLGIGHPVHYLFAWEDPAEIRATGGFIGATDYFTIRAGAFTSIFRGRTPSTHEITSVPPPLPEAAYTPEQYWLLCDSNWSPDFPLSARLERWFYGEDTGRWAEGVIDFVDTAIPGILRATGAIYVPEYRRWVNAQNVETLAQQYINGTYSGPVQRGPPDTARKQFFGAIMKALLQRVQTLPLDKWPALARSLQDAMSRRDLMLYDRRTDIESVMAASGAAGRMPRSTADYLYVVDDNRSYNKLNPFVHESIQYDVHILPTLWLDSTVSIHYHVSRSPADLEGRGPYYGLWGTKHDYQDFLRVYVPPGAVLAGVEGMAAWRPAPAYHLTQFSGRLLVREGRDAMVRIHYRVPANVFSSSGFQRYELTVPHEPGSVLDSFRVRVSGAIRTGANPNGDSQSGFETAVPAGQIWHLSVPLHGSFSPESIALPADHKSVDPYIGFRFLHDPQHSL